MNEIQLAELPFPYAAQLWIDQHKRYIKQNTLRNYSASVRNLVGYLGPVLVSDIHIGHVRAYQEERGKSVGAYQLNTEVSVLQMILKEARCWKPIAELYRPLRVPKRRGGHSISAEEERILREVALSKPKWLLAAHCMTIMLSTTMGFGELRHIRRRDVDLKRRNLLVRDGERIFIATAPSPSIPRRMNRCVGSWIDGSYWAAARKMSSFCLTGRAR